MTTTTNIGAGVSRYLRLYSVLLQALGEGRIGPGEALPSEPQLVREYGVSRTTVRRALARLEAEGCIVRRRGSGTYARGNGEQLQAPKDLSALLDAAAGPPAATRVRPLAFERIPTPVFLRGQQPAFGDIALLIRQVRSVQGEPVVLETTYVPQVVGTRLTRRRLGGGTVLAALAALGHRGESLEREFAAVAADPLTAHSLGLAIGAPALNVRSVVRDSRRRILAYASFFYRPDRYEAHAAAGRGSPGPTRTARRI